MKNYQFSLIFLFFVAKHLTKSIPIAFPPKHHTRFLQIKAFQPTTSNLRNFNLNDIGQLEARGMKSIKEIIIIIFFCYPFPGDMKISHDFTNVGADDNTISYWLKLPVEIAWIGSQDLTIVTGKNN